MTGILASSVAVSVTGAVLALDRSAALQTMVSRPIVTGPVIGYLLGALPAGLVAGTLLELLFIGELPVGAYVPVHETGLTVLVVALMSQVPGVNGHGAPYPLAAAVFPVAFVAALPVSVLYQKADVYTRKLNGRIYRRAEEMLERDVAAHLMRENLKGLLFCLAVNVLVLFVTVYPMSLAIRAASTGLDTGSLDGLSPALAGCLVLGAAAAYKVVSGDRMSLVVCSASALVAGVIIAVAA